MENSYFTMQVDDAIRGAEKLLKKLNTIKSDYAEMRIEEALEKSVTAAKLSEAVTLKTRSLPAHTGHPRAEPMIREAIAEAVPVEIGFTVEGWLKIEIPILLPRKEKSSRSYIRGFLYPALERFAFSRDKIRFRNCVMIFRHVYDQNRPEREYRDHDNIELNTVVDVIAMFFLVDDTPLECRHYYYSAAGDVEKTEVYIVPRADFQHWLDMENVESNYTAGSLAELADLLHYDISWLSREIKRKTGKTYTQIVQEKRLAQAAFLLKNTDRNVADISVAVGYENISYFHKIFASVYGRSPKHFRDDF